MRLQGFRGNCDSQGKLGMCPSLAEPHSGGIPRRTSLRFEYYLINTFVKEGSLPSIFKGCLALLSLRDISPHCGESSTSPS